MPHLAYLEQMLEKGRGFVVRIFPRGLVPNRWVCPNPLKLIYIYSLLLCSSKVYNSTGQDAHRRLVLQVYLGSNTSSVLYIGEVFVSRFRK